MQHTRLRHCYVTGPYTQELHRLEAEASLDPRLRIYCPNKDCSSPLLLPDDNGTAFPRDQPATCPACRRAFCPTCMVPGWHQVGPSLWYR